MNKPDDLYLLHANELWDTELCCLTEVNSSVLNEICLGEYEEFWFDGANGDRVHSWFVKPIDLDQGKKYPLAVIIHGGPQVSNLFVFISIKRLCKV